MVVMSRCFAFHMLITPAWIWKRFWVEKLKSLLYLPISSVAQPSKIFRNMLCQFMYKTSQLVRISLLINALNKRVLLFFLEKLFHKSNRKLFFCVCISWYKHSQSLENSRQLCKPSTLFRVCITVLNSPNPSRVCIRLCKQGKCFLLLKFITLICVLYSWWKNLLTSDIYIYVLMSQLL